MFELAYHWPGRDPPQVSRCWLRQSALRSTSALLTEYARLEDFAGEGIRRRTQPCRHCGHSGRGDEVVERAGHFREEMIFADQARRSILESIPELTVQAAPTSRPEIRFFYAQQIDWRQGGVSIKHYIHPPTITWHLGGVYVDVRG